jgi:TM2 domain-containing membrane protein YozV
VLTRTFVLIDWPRLSLPNRKGCLMANEWHFKIGDRVHGPFTDSQLDQLIRSGRVDADTPVRPSENTVWRRAGDIAGLFGNPKPIATTATAEADAIMDEVLFDKPMTSVDVQHENGPTKPCPFCAEMIQAAAVKCRHCGEFMDGRRPITTRRPVAAAPNASSHSPREVWNPGTAAVLSFLIAGLGQLYKGQLFVGILFPILVYTLYGIAFSTAPVVFLYAFSLHVAAVIDAAKSDPTAKSNPYLIGCFLVLMVSVVVVPLLLLLVSGFLQP